MPRKILKNKIAIIIGIFAVIAFAVTAFLNPELFQASVIAKPGIDICSFTTPGGYINMNTWQEHLDGLPSNQGPEDKIGLLGYQITCTTNNCNPNNFRNSNSIAREARELPYSTHAIHLLNILINNNSSGDAVVGINGDTTILDGSLKGVYDASKIVQSGVLVNANSDSANLALFVRNKTALSKNAKICAIALFQYKTGYTSQITGKVTGTEPDEVDGIDGAEVTISPCPFTSNGVPTVPASETCMVEADSQGNYLFPSVLPLRNGYEVRGAKKEL